MLIPSVVVKKIIPCQLETDAACPNVGINFNSMVLVLILLNLEVESKHI
jgi:hypothetical protein